MMKLFIVLFFSFNFVFADNWHINSIKDIILIIISQRNEVYFGLIVFFIIIIYLMYTNKKLRNITKENKEANDNFKMLLDNILEAVVIMDNETQTIINANHIAQKLLNLPKEKLVGKSIFDFIDENYLDTVKKSLKNQKTKPYEIKLISTDGSIFYALVSGQNFTFRNKNLRLITILDLTEIKEKERILAHQSKMASMGEMIGNIAHQWRQPIAIVSMQVNNMLADIELDNIDINVFKENLLAINIQNKHLSKTIDDFRNFFADNKEETEFDIKTAIEESVNLLKASFKTHNIDLVINLKSIMYKGIKNELNQAFINILNNAKDVLVNNIDKTQDRVVFIESGYSKPNVIYISITDNGGGIADDIIDKIFQPYFTTKHKSQGTGIGLYMTREIIYKHLKGEIKVSNETIEYNSKTYTGAKFCIEIPILK